LFLNKTYHFRIELTCLRLHYDNENHGSTVTCIISDQSIKYTSIHQGPLRTVYCVRWYFNAIHQRLDDVKALKYVVSIVGIIAAAILPMEWQKS